MCDSDDPAWLLLAAWQHRALILALASVALSALHAAEEVEGEGGPLWRYFARRTGAPVPDHLGFLLVALLLPAALATLAVAGYLGGSPWCLGLLAGARLSDSLFSHWLPSLLGARPNPGDGTSLLCALEGAGLAALATPPWSALVLGMLPFAVLWPLLFALGGRLK